ncbi:hypothetical protein [Nocardia brevicatena]|uniref:hypothetical protein n=1 Tax=Nocardia brevicatena TaxID=37327 RepID=UPI0012FADFE7|nr:hypothetical protein [Nocardia brevicatena]
MTIEAGQLRDHIDLMTSARILADPVCGPEALGEFERFLRDYHDVEGADQLDQRPEAAMMLMRQDLRRSIQRVVTHRVAEVLLPIALDLLGDDSHAMDRIEREKVTDVDQWEGARYRVFFGDEAKIAAAYEYLFMSAAEENLFSCFTPEQAEALRRINYDATIALREAASATRDKEYAESPVMEVIANEPYVTVDDAARVTMRMRTVSFMGNTAEPVRANNSLRPDILHQLHTNAVGFGEFYGSAVGTILPYTFKEDGCPRQVWIETELSSIAPISAVAALKDGPAGNLLFSDRGKRVYRATENSGRWILEAVRQPLVSAAERVARAEAKDLGRKGFMGHWGRCPSNQALAPNQAEAEQHAELVDKIDQITGGHAPEHLRTIVTPADVCAILAVGLVAALEQRGIVRLDPTSLEPVPRHEPADL